MTFDSLQKVSVENHESYTSTPDSPRGRTFTGQVANVDGRSSVSSRSESIHSRDAHCFDSVSQGVSTPPPPYSKLEEEAIEILKTSKNFEDVKAVCKILFEDANIPCTMLAGRRTGGLNAFLSILCGKRVNDSDKLPTWNERGAPVRGKAANKTRTRRETAKMIVCLSRQQTDSSYPPATDLNWIIRAMDSPMDVAIIAETLHIEISSAFSKIPYSSWVRHIFGYHDATFLTFLGGISNSHNDFAQYFQELDLEREKWGLLSEALKHRNPLAFWMISTSLYSYEILPRPSDALHFLSDPIQQFFATQDCDLISKLKRLAFLAERYQSLCADDMDWHHHFSIKCQFLDDIHNQEHLAHSITEAVSDTYRLISPADYIDPDSKHLDSLARKWTALSYNVAACVGADISLLPFAMRLGEILVRLKNYHSARAVGCGLGKVGSWSATSWPIWKLITPENNFAACTARSKDLPGLPYLPELIHDLRQSVNASEQLYKTFEYVRYFEAHQTTHPLDRALEQERVVEKGGREALAWSSEFVQKFRGFFKCNSIRNYKNLL